MLIDDSRNFNWSAVPDPVLKAGEVLIDVNLMGAKVVTSVGSDEKAEFVRELGADEAVNRKTENPGVLFERNDVDVVLDCVGGSVLGENIGKLAIGGRWVLVSTLGGETPNG
jgi:NADPH:quinone reductase-like Zn-dependent oxidoreductase